MVDELFKMLVLLGYLDENVCLINFQFESLQDLFETIFLFKNSILDAQEMHKGTRNFLLFGSSVLYIFFPCFLFYFHDFMIF